MRSMRRPGRKPAGERDYSVLERGRHRASDRRPSAGESEHMEIIADPAELDAQSGDA